MWGFVGFLMDGPAAVFTHALGLEIVPTFDQPWLVSAAEAGRVFDVLARRRRLELCRLCVFARGCLAGRGCMCAVAAAAGAHGRLRHAYGAWRMGA